MLSPGQRQELAEALVAELDKTRSAITAYEEMTAPVSPENAIGRVSRMDAIQNKSVAEAALRQARSKLDALETMEKRLDDPELGICVKCKQPIPLKRVILMPQSPYCVHCAS
ncbi:MAG: TraR/DksA C4-type zinc finger protein [Saprospiraceae bacterium]|nr:TraR/DksA C4-type zinc finger protein [Saprospiraceae bacterium]MCB9312304.1 TraR/DksA C4-type zinc finger protein [Lewinellaceae bacterium]